MAPDAQDTPATRRNWLLSHPRTASNLLMRILNLEAQPTIQQHGRKQYFFLASLGLKLGEYEGHYSNEWTEDEKGKFMATIQRCYETLNTALREAEANGKSVYIKEHASWIMEPIAEAKFALGDNFIQEVPIMVDAKEYGNTRSPLNKTIFPDEFLRTWRPTILIRHPALVFPSLYRTSVDLQGKDLSKAEPVQVVEVEMTFHWLRTMYDFYDEQVGHQSDGSGAPIVLDANDLMSGPQVVRKYCQIIGLDPEKLQFQWPVASEEELGIKGFMEKRMLSTLFASSGIVAEKSSMSISIEDESNKWIAEFGESEAVKMKRWVLAAMSDYEYLREKRLTASA